MLVLNNFWFKISKKRIFYLYIVGGYKVGLNILGVNNYFVRGGAFWFVVIFFVEFFFRVILIIIVFSAIDIFIIGGIGVYKYIM